MLRYYGAALIALAAILALRGQKSEFAGMVSLAAGILLFGGAAEAFLPALREIGALLEGSALGGYAATLMKALGVTLAAQFTAELCRDAGEGALASRLELAGRAEILLLALPLIRELLALAAGLLGR